MKLAVVGGEAPFARRALDDLARRGIASEITTVPARAGVGEIAEAAREADAVVAGDLDSGVAMRVPLAAIAAGRPAVLPSWSANDHRDHLELDADAREAGVTVVTGASASPAIPTLLALHACRDMSEVRSVEVAWAVPPSALGDSEVRRALLEGLTSPVLVRPGGNYAYARAGRPVPVDFPSPVGQCRAGLFGGAEAWSLAALLPGRPELRVVLGGTVPWWAPLAAGPRLLARFGQDTVSTALASASARLAQATGEPGWAAVRVEIEGLTGVASTTRVLGGFDRLEVWDATSLALGVAVLHHGAAPGVVVAGAGLPAVDSLLFFHDTGIRFANLEAAA